MVPGADGLIGGAKTSTSQCKLRKGHDGIRNYDGYRVDFSASILDTMCFSNILLNLGKLSNGWTDWHQIWHTCAVLSWNGYTSKKLPLETQGGHLGVLGSQTLKLLGSCQTAGPIGTTFGTRLRIRLGMDISSIQFAPQYPRGNFGGFRGSEIQKSVEAVKRLDRLAPSLAHMCRFIIMGMDIRQTNCPSRHKGALGGF